MWPHTHEKTPDFCNTLFMKCKQKIHTSNLTFIITSKLLCNLKFLIFFPLPYLCKFTHVNSLKMLRRLNSQIQTIVIYAFILC